MNRYEVTKEFFDIVRAEMAKASALVGVPTGKHYYQGDTVYGLGRVVGFFGEAIELRNDEFEPSLVPALAHRIGKQMADDIDRRFAGKNSFSYICAPGYAMSSEAKDPWQFRWIMNAVPA